MVWFYCHCVRQSEGFTRPTSKLVNKMVHFVSSLMLCDKFIDINFLSKSYCFFNAFRCEEHEPICIKVIMEEFGTFHFDCQAPYRPVRKMPDQQCADI